MSGLINLGIFCVSIFVLQILSYLAAFTSFMRLALFFVSVVITAYIFYYFVECIRDSALGGIRAPDNTGSMPDKSDALSQLWDIFISIVIFWVPVLSYYFYKTLSQQGGAEQAYNPRTDLIYWLLLGYGIFFFPIGILALAMFNSSSAYNPVVWIVSIFSTFFQYCGLVLLFFLLYLLFSRIVATFQGGLLNRLLFTFLNMYIIMIAAHLLGRFYYNNSQKLNWEV